MTWPVTPLCWILEYPRSLLVNHDLISVLNTSEFGIFQYGLTFKLLLYLNVSKPPWHISENVLLKCICFLRYVFYISCT